MYMIHAVCVCIHNPDLLCVPRLSVCLFVCGIYAGVYMRLSVCLFVCGPLAPSQSATSVGHNGSVPWCRGAVVTRTNIGTCVCLSVCLSVDRSRRAGAQQASDTMTEGRPCGSGPQEAPRCKRCIERDDVWKTNATCKDHFSKEGVKTDDMFLLRKCT